MTNIPTLLYNITSVTTLCDHLNSTKDLRGSLLGQAFVPFASLRSRVAIWPAISNHLSSALEVLCVEVPDLYILLNGPVNEGFEGNQQVSLNHLHNLLSSFRSIEYCNVTKLSIIHINCSA